MVFKDHDDTFLIVEKLLSAYHNVLLTLYISILRITIAISRPSCLWMTRSRSVQLIFLGTFSFPVGRGHQSDRPVSLDHAGTFDNRAAGKEIPSVTFHGAAVYRTKHLGYLGIH